jgi:hypothetical protein
VIDRQHRPRAPRRPRQSCKSGPVHALPLPTPLFNISTFKSKLRRGWRTEIPIWSGPSTVFPSYPLSFQTIAHSFALTQNSTLLFSSASALFAKNHPGWGVLMANQLTPGFNVSTFKSKIPIGSGRSDVQTFQRVLATPFFPSRRTVAFPQQGTSRPLCGAPVPCTIKVHAGAKLASRAWPPRLGHGWMGAESGRLRPRRSRQ